MGRSKSDQEEGRVWEDVAAAENRLLQLARRANVRRRLPEMVPTEANGDGSMRAYHVQGEQTVDFDGHLCGKHGGRRVAFDTKSTSNEKAFKFDLISDGQMEMLHSLAADGPLAFVYVQRREPWRRRSFVVRVGPDGKIEGVEHRRMASLSVRGQQFRAQITWEELEARGCRVGPGETWLDVVERLQKKGDEAGQAAGAVAPLPGLESFVLTSDE